MNKHQINNNNAKQQYLKKKFISITAIYYNDYGAQCNFGIGKLLPAAAAATATVVCVVNSSSYQSGSSSSGQLTRTWL